MTHRNYRQLHLNNSQFVFERALNSDRAIVSINIAPEECYAHFNANAGCGVDALTGENVDFGGGLRMEAYSAKIITQLK